MPPRPPIPIEGTPTMSGPPRPKPSTTTAPGFKPSFPGQAQFPGQQMAAGPPVPGGPVPPTNMMIGPNGEQIFFHPHYPQLKADICKTCRHVIPIRPPKFAKKLTKEQRFVKFFEGDTSSNGHSDNTSNAVGRHVGVLLASQIQSPGTKIAFGGRPVGAPFSEPKLELRRQSWSPKGLRQRSQF